MRLPPLFVFFDSEPVELIEFEERLRALLQRAKQVDLVTPDLEPEKVHQLFAIFKNNVRAMLIYRLHSCSGPMTVIKAGQSLVASLLVDHLGWS